MTNDNELKVLITAQSDQLKSGMAEAQTAVKSAVDGMTSQFGYLHSSIEHISVGIRENFKIIAETIVAALSVKAIKEAISAAEEYAGSVRKLSNMMGMTAEDASRMNAALQIAGISTEEYVGANLRLMRQLKANEGKFAALGVEVRDASGAFLAQPIIFENVINKMKEYKSGADQLQFAMDMLGARGADAAFKFLRLKEAQEMAAPLMKSLNLEMGQNGVNAAKRYEMQVNTLGLVFTALKVNIGMELIPTLTDLAKEFILIAQEVIPTLMLAGKGLVSAFLEIRGVAAMVAGAIVTAFTSAGYVIGGLAAMFDRFKEGDITGGWVALKAGISDAKNEVVAYGATVEEIANDTAAKIEKLWSSASPMKGGEKTGGTKQYTPVDKDKKEKSRLPEWKEELEQMKEAEGNFFDFSLAREREFWEEKAKLQNKTAVETRSINHELYAVRKKEAKEATDEEIAEIKFKQASDKTSWAQKLALEDQKIAALASLYGKDSKNYRDALKEKQKLEEEARKVSIAAQQKIEESQVKGAESLMRIREIENRTKAELGVISEKQEIEMNRKELDSIYQLELASMNRRAEMLKEYPKEYSDMLDKIKELESRHNEAVAKSQQSLALEQKKRWDSFMAPIKSALDHSIQGIIQGTTTLKKAFQDLAQSILISMGNMLIQLGLKWAEQQAMQLLGIGTTKAAQTAATTATMAEKTTEAGVVIPLEAAEAGAGAAAAVAPIPFIGPILAIAAMASVFGAVMGLMSAEQGWDVDKGGLTMIHDKEMVLPSNLAEGVRNMTERGGGGGTTTFNIQAWDSKDVGAFLKKHGSSVAGALKGPRRNFQFNLGRT